MTWSTAIPVQYTGSRSAEGPLTIGQHNVLDWLGVEPDHRYASLEWVFELPPSTTIADVSAAVAVLLSRHEGLRTEYLLVGEARQRVQCAGTLPIDVYLLDEVNKRPEQIADALVARLKPARRLDVAMRVAIAVSASAGSATGAETVLAAVALYSHLVVDFHAMAVLGHEFTAMLRNPALRRVGPPRHQPLDQAAIEHSAEAQPRLAAALRYWEQQQSVMPSCAYPAPPSDDLIAADAEPAGAATLSSSAIALALPHIEARTRASRATIIMAAACFVLARRASLPACRIPILSVNRFDPQLADFVGSLAQTTMLAVDVTGAGFDDLVRRTHSAMLRASRFGAYDIYRRVDLTRQIVHQRGVKLGVEPIFNSLVQPLRPGRLRPGGLGPASVLPGQLNLAAINDALERTWISWSPSTCASPVAFELLAADRVVRLRGITGDTTRITRIEIESLLGAVERLLIAAVPGDLTAAEIGPATGIEPLQRGPGWLYTDHCWIELAAVCRLTSEALAPATVRVEVRGDQIVARVTATPQVRHPEQAHERCLSALPGRPTAMTPHHYVIHAATTSSDTSLDHDGGVPVTEVDWQRLPVVAEGSGR
jgi:hypothetical protein